MTQRERAYGAERVVAAGRFAFAPRVRRREVSRTVSKLSPRVAVGGSHRREVKRDAFLARLRL